MTVPASRFRSWAASVKLAEVMRARSSSMTMHLAWRQARFLPSVARDRGVKHVWEPLTRPDLMAEIICELP